ncbi:MAG: hypothetical protein SOT46_11170 [Treponema sp.]|nr:hypothetical protein [Treponema sp.]
MAEKKDFWDKASDFLESHWESYAIVCATEREEKAKKNKEICDKLRKSALNPNTVYRDENGKKLSLIGSIPKRVKVLNATKKKR